MPKTETLHVRVTPEVRRLAERAAKKSKRTLSDFSALAIEEGSRTCLKGAK